MNPSEFLDFESVKKLTDAAEQISKNQVLLLDAIDAWSQVPKNTECKACDLLAEFILSRLKEKK